MRLQVIDPNAHFSCGSCTFCCDQPWHTYIEADKAEALHKHDFSKYPQLAGKTFYHKSREADEGYHILGKGEGTKCLFLDTDGLCIIHKEMGAEAKPMMCRQFPYLPGRNFTDDRVSVNFGCPAVQAQSGPPLTEQRADIEQVCPPRSKAPNPHARVFLDPEITLSVEEFDALMERAIALFDDRRTGSIWDRFAELLSLLVAVGKHRRANQSDAATDPRLIEMIRSDGPHPDLPAAPRITCFPNASEAPSAARLLFASTIFRDAVPRERVQKGMGFFKRITLLPKVMSLAKLNGVYPSLVLGRNVSIRECLAHDVGEAIAPAGEKLLLRYFRTRFWQRLLAGTRLTVIAGVHQHIQDFNAIMFLARAEAHHTGAKQLSEALIRKGLTCVEFHFANQARAFDQKLVGWFQAQLQNPVVALQSLRLMAITKPADSEVRMSTAASKTL